MEREAGVIVNHQMELEPMSEEIKALIKKASADHSSIAAMQFSQAALNAANAEAVMVSVQLERMRSGFVPTLVAADTEVR